jgi:hypothetical protein
VQISAQFRRGDQTHQSTQIGSQKKEPGVYCFASSASNTGLLQLDAQGNVNAVWVFKTVSTLITGSASTVTTINSGHACNVFWQVGSSATLGTTTTFVGNILALTDITLQTGATLSGRALVQTGTVTLDSNSVSVCSLAGGLATTTLATQASAAVQLGGLIHDTAVLSGGCGPHWDDYVPVVRAQRCHMCCGARLYIDRARHRQWQLHLGEFCALIDRRLSMDRGLQRRCGQRGFDYCLQ